MISRAFLTDCLWLQCYTAGVKEMERKWRGLLLTRQQRILTTVMAAWHTWAEKQANTGRNVLGAMLRSQHSWMKACRFAQLRLFAFCRARMRERQKLFGQQLQIGLGGRKYTSNPPLLASVWISADILLVVTQTRRSPTSQSSPSLSRSPRRESTRSLWKRPGCGSETRISRTWRPASGGSPTRAA